MSTGLLIFAAALALPGICGLIAATYLRASLSQVLAYLCGNANRSDFWTRMACIGFIIVPTAWSLAHGPMEDGPLTWSVLRNLFSVSINGVLLVLFMLGVAMWRQVPQPRSAAQGSR